MKDYVKIEMCVSAGYFTLIKKKKVDFTQPLT